MAPESTDRGEPPVPPASPNDNAVTIEDTASQSSRSVVFAAPAGDPRARRPVDVVKLLASLGIGLVAAWFHRGGNDLDARVSGLFADDLPSWLSAPFTIVFVVGGVYALVLLISILFFGDGRAAVARDMVVAGLLAAAASLGTSFLGGPQWPDIFPEFLDRGDQPSFPVVRLAVTTALVLVAQPFLTVPMRRIGGRLLVGMAVAAVMLGYGTVTSIIGALALGVGSAAAVHLIFGSGIGVPSLARIRDALDAIGVEVADIEYLDHQPIGATLVRAELRSGDPIAVKVYGRDAADAALATRAWRSAWYRDSHRPVVASGLQQVEHEALLLWEARQAAAPVPELAGWGPGRAGDAVIAVRLEPGVRLSELTVDETDDELLRGCWRALEGLHQAGIVHRQIDTDTIVAVDGTVILTDLSGAIKSSDPLVKATDVAQMLVATAAASGTDQAITAARTGVGDEALAAALPVLQASALPGSLRHQAKAAGLDLKDLRSATTDAIGTEPPPMVQIQRVTWGNVAMVVLTVIAATALISSLSDIGLDTIADEVADASWTWIITAFVLAQLTNIGEWISLTGLVPRVPFGPTFRFRYAIAFISLAVPSDAGAIAMNIRFMQRQGVPWPAAVAQGPLLTVVTKAFDIILLVLSAGVVGETVDLDDVDSGPVLRLIVLVVVLAIVGGATTLIVPSLRSRVVPPIKEGFTGIRDSITDPQRLMRVASGTLLQRVLFGMTLAASAQAFGGSVTFAEAVFVNSIVSLFLGFMPVPGGIGIGEAALSTGLAAMGMPESAAMAAAVTHRMVTVYLPPIYGWYTTRWLTDNDYL